MFAVALAGTIYSLIKKDKRIDLIVSIICAVTTLFIIVKMICIPLHSNGGLSISFGIILALIAGIASAGANWLPINKDIKL